MSHVIVYTPAFIRAARQLTAKAPRLADNLRATLELMEANPFDPSLRSHKLKGALKDYWACSAATTCGLYSGSAHPMDAKPCFSRPLAAMMKCTDSASLAVAGFEQTHTIPVMVWTWLS